MAKFKQVNFYIITVRQNLTPEIIWNEYKLGLMDKKTAFEGLFSFIENSNDDAVRVKCIIFLQQIDHDRMGKYRIFENIAITDSDEKVKLGYNNYG